MEKAITLRPVRADDESFLFELFRTVHEQEFAQLSLPDEERDKLLHMQFTAQQGQYHGQYAGADFDLVLCGDVPVGSLFALRGPDDYVLIDISLLPDQRNKGIGTQLVSALIEQAHAAGQPLHAHVRRGNPAWRLWRRLGFEQVADDGAYLQIRVPTGARKA